MTQKAGDVDLYHASQLTQEFNATLLQQLQEEFDAIYRAFQGVHHLPLRRTAPPRPKEGMVAWAPGAPAWDPGGGKGAYVYDGTTWLKMT